MIIRTTEVGIKIIMIILNILKVTSTTQKTIQINECKKK